MMQQTTEKVFESLQTTESDPIDSLTPSILDPIDSAIDSFFCKKCKSCATTTLPLNSGIKRQNLTENR